MDRPLGKLRGLAARPPLLLSLPIAVALGALLPTPLGFLVLPPLALLPRFARDLAEGRPEAAARRALAWALFLSALTIAATLVAPDRMSTRILRGPAYRDEMLRWIATGVGKEGNLRAFLPEHLLHLALLIAASFATGGAAGLLLGTLLLHYMNFYVASLALVSRTPLASLAVGWPIWSIVRVVGFVLVAVAVAGPAYGCFRQVGASLRRGRRLLAAGLALAALDIVLKFFLAEHWRHLLGWSLGAR